MTSLLQIDNLETILHTGATPIRAVDGLTLQIQKGETFALLGESGCGKSMAALSMMRLLPDVGEIVSGSVRFGGEDLLLKSEASMRSIRGKHIS
jgi:peptide/nickel transport system ATP-binding protein